MSSRKRKLPTPEEINAILFASDDSSEIESEDDGWSSQKGIPDESMILTHGSSEEELESGDDDNENEKNAQDADINFSWTSTILNEKINAEMFPKAGGGPKHDLNVGSKPIDYFKLLFNDEMCKEICINSNKYAQFKLSNEEKAFSWKTIETEEFWRFLAILLIMGISKLPRMTDYWSVNPILGNAKVKKTMKRDRFLQIYRFFHVSDREREVPPNHADYYLMQKVDPLLSELKINFQKYFEPYHRMSIDEAMIKYKGRLGIIQYMPMKPVKRGIKVWMQCTSFLGYVNNFELYCGKKDKLPRSSYGLGYSVVTHLSKSLTGHHHLYFDRFFTSVILMRDLLKIGHYSSGTVMRNRKHLPVEISKIKLSENGASKTYQCIEQNNLLLSAWHDKNDLFLLSTAFKDELTTVKRRIGGEINEISCPSSIADYNKYMGGVDLCDQNRKYYDISRKSKKWWMYVFWFLVNITVDNSFILFSTTNFPQEKKPKSLLEFKLNLIDELIGEDFSMPSGSKKDTVSHKRVKISGRKKTCFLCRKENRRTVTNRQIESSWMCERCDICLCIQCFGPYHMNMG